MISMTVIFEVDVRCANMPNIKWPRLQTLPTIQNDLEYYIWWKIKIFILREKYLYSSEKYFLCIKSLCPGPGHFLSSASACIMCEWNLLTWPRLNTKLSTINHQMYKEDKTCVQLHLFDQIYDTDNTHCARLLCWLVAIVEVVGFI